MLLGTGCAGHRALYSPYSLELVGLGALRNGHKNATMVTPGVIVGSRQRLEEKHSQGVHQSCAELGEKLGWRACFDRSADPSSCLGSLWVELSIWRHQIQVFTG